MEHDELIQQATKRCNSWIEQAKLSKMTFRDYDYPGVALAVCEGFKSQISLLSDEELSALLSDKAGDGILVQCREYEKNVELENAQSYLQYIEMPVDLCKYLPLLECMRSKEYLNNLYIVQHPESKQFYNTFREACPGLSEQELNESFAKWMSQKGAQPQPQQEQEQSRDDYDLFRENRQNYILEMQERLKGSLLSYDEYLFRAGKRAGDEKLRMVYKDDIEYCAWRTMESGESDVIIAEWNDMWVDNIEMEQYKEEYLSTFYGSDRDQKQDAVRLQQCIGDLPSATLQDLEAKRPPENYILYYAISVAMQNRAIEEESKNNANIDERMNEVYDAYNEYIGVCATMDVPFELGGRRYHNKMASRQANAMKERLADYVWATYDIEIDNPKQLSEFMRSNPQAIPEIKRAIEQHMIQLDSFRQQYQQAVQNEREYNERQQVYSDRGRDGYYTNNDSRHTSNQRYHANNSRSNVTYPTQTSYNFNRPAVNSPARGDMPPLKLAISIILGMAAIILVLIAIVIRAWYLIIPALSILAAVVVGHVTKKVYLAAIIAIVPTILLCVVMSYI